MIVFTYRSWLSINADMPDITKTPGIDEGVQFDFKKLFIKVAEKEVC